MSRFNSENEKRAREIISLYPRSRSALLPLLHLAQEQNGWLTPESIKNIAEILELTSAEVLSVASFYDMYHTEAVGRNVIGVCTNLACMIDGGYELLEHAEEKLEVRVGGTTADGEFTLEEIECVAKCDKAPVCAVNWRYFANMSTAQFDRLVDDLRANKYASDIPDHGVISRVRRNVGLLVNEDEARAK